MGQLPSERESRKDSDPRGAAAGFNRRSQSAFRGSCPRGRSACAETARAGAVAGPANTALTGRAFAAAAAAGAVVSFGMRSSRRCSHGGTTLNHSFLKLYGNEHRQYRAQAAPRQKRATASDFSAADSNEWLPEATSPIPNVTSLQHNRSQETREPTGCFNDGYPSRVRVPASASAESDRIAG